MAVRRAPATLRPISSLLSTLFRSPSSSAQPACFPSSLPFCLIPSYLERFPSFSPFFFLFFFFLSFLFSLNFVTSFVQGGPFAAWHRGAFVCVPLFSFPPPPLSRKIFVSVQITEVSIRRRFMRNYTLYQHDKRDIEILGR